MKIQKNQLDTFAKTLLRTLHAHAAISGATILALEGDLGAGKTALTQALARNLGVGESVPSPTFVLMRNYATQDSIFKTLVHIDAYRIEDVTELRPLHLDQVFAQSHTLVCIEWPQKLADTLPKGAIRLVFTQTGEEERDVSLPPEFEPYFEGLF